MSHDRLGGLDAAFLCMEHAESPMHVGGLAVFRSEHPVQPLPLIKLLVRRAAGIDRLRRRIRYEWPTGVARWVDDTEFDANLHIHAHRLDDRGRQCLEELAASLMASRLDLARPLWEIHLITGYADGRFAVLLKLHHAMADGISAMQITLGLLDGDRGTGPRSEPATAGRPLVARAAGLLSGPARLAGITAKFPAQLPRAIDDARAGLTIAYDVLRETRLPPVRSAVAAATGTARRFTAVTLSMDEVRQARRAHGGTANDVLLAALAGALRSWLISRRRRTTLTPLRALIPVSTRTRTTDAKNGNQLSGYLCDLPIDESDPVARLRLVRAQMDASKAAGPYRGAGALPLLAARLPFALHYLMGPLISRSAPLLFDTVITNVPMPSVFHSLAGAELLEIVPVVPLPRGHGLGIAMIAYRGSIHIGLHANVEAVPALDRLAAMIPESLRALSRHKTADGGNKRQKPVGDFSAVLPALKSPRDLVSLPAPAGPR
jgi:diacylglycerol O-acyltransferase